MDAGEFATDLMRRIASRLELPSARVAAVTLPLLTMAAACSARTVGTSTDEASSSGSGSEGAETGATVTGTSAGVTTAGEASESDESGSGGTGGVLDVMPATTTSSTESESDTDGSCDIDPVPPDIEVPEECSQPPDPGDYWQVGMVCFYPLDGDSCTDHPYDDACILQYAPCGGGQWGGATEILCGPLPTETGQCCYATAGECPPPGRPFIVEQEARLASLQSNQNWSSGRSPGVQALDAKSRAALADLWAQDGLFEHASVASFARFALQLLSLGAPPNLLVETQVAIGEEIEHARICFGLASAYAGRSLGPGPLDISGGLDAKTLTSIEIARSLAAEGCIAETVSAILIASAAAQATDPTVRGLLEQIAADEGRHALLAWRSLDWMLQHHPECHEAVARTFGHAERHIALGPATELPHNAHQLEAHGQLSLEKRAALARAAVAEVVRPLARERLASLASPSVGPILPT
jgi:hypothetical protein